MTLYRQLVAFTLVLFLLLFTGIWVEKLKSTRSFLVNQMESHAQDTATSLGLLLSPIMAANDLSTAETMINAVFDRGYYKTIVLRDVDGKELIEKKLHLQLEGVPSWFMKILTIQAPKTESLVMNGWTQAGTILVESHPGYAYRTMWDAALKMALYFLLSGAAVLLLGGLGLRLLLKPLKLVEKQAEAICRREYPIQKELPRTRELRRVVESMNKMTGQVQSMFSSQVKAAEELRRKAYSDQLTGLGNRRYLRGQVEARLKGADQDKQGAFFMVQLDNLQKINATEGFETADELLKEVASILRQNTIHLKDVALARLTGGDFAIFADEISSPDAHKLAENLSKKISALSARHAGKSDHLANIGGVAYKARPSLSLLLAEADSALQAARRKGTNHWLVKQLSTDGKDIVRGKNWWRNTLEEVLEKGNILLFAQPVVNSHGQQMTQHQELLSRIEITPGEIVSAALFIPMAEQLQLISRLDKIVLQKIFTEINKADKFESIAINLAPSSINNEDFVRWLLDKLRKNTNTSSHIIFEFPEYGAVQYLDVIKDFSQQLQNLGHGIGLDHFGQSFANFGYLKSLKPEYVKIDRAFTHELVNEHDDSEFYIRSLCSVAHSLDIQVIAEGVEEKEQAEQLLKLDIDALQGYLFGTPERI